MWPQSADGPFSLGEPEAAGTRRPGPGRAGPAGTILARESPEPCPKGQSCRGAGTVARSSVPPTRSSAKWAAVTLRGLIWGCKGGWALTDTDPVRALIDEKKQ